MRFKSTLNATRSAGGSGFCCGFLALLARVRANSFQMKRVFVGGIIMGRAPEDIKPSICEGTLRYCVMHYWSR
jgi:hypothetical protein